MSEQLLERATKNWKPPFFTIWGGQAFSLLGSQLVQFALIWWLTKLTGSATVLAIASLVGLFPQVFFGPLVGTLVDRWNRRVVMIIADSFIALVTLVLAGLFWLELVQVWHIYALMFLRAVAGLFHWSAMQASTSLMVPTEHLARVQGLNQMLGGLMNIGAAPLGALLLEILPMQGILGIDVATALIAVLPLLFIPIPQPRRQTSPKIGEDQTSVWQEMRAGFKYIWAWPGLMMILIMATMINMLLTPAGSLQPILVTKHFGGQAIHLAWLESAFGIGVVVGGFTLSAWGGFRKQIVTSMAALIILGLGMGSIGMVPASMLWLAVVLFFIVGFTNPLVNGPVFAVMQAAVAPEMQGRVFTLVGSVAAGMAPVGLILAGPLADAFGVQSWFLIGGIVTVLLGLGTFFIPTIMNIEEDGRKRQASILAQEDTAL